MKRMSKVALVGMGLICLMAAGALCNPSDISVFDMELHKVKYNYAYSTACGSGGSWDFDDSGIASSEAERAKTPGYKSPGKAFILSMAVPGLGQYYYGSKVKAAAFLGIEATAWILHLNWHNKGQELTDEFQAFNQQHWIQDHYEDYLEDAYGVRDDESIPDSISAPEASHNLPDTRTQQYYEMTGKYDQFAWGWDDATLDSLTHTNYDTSATLTFQPIINAPTLPYSANRFQYEIMRDNANKKLDNADKMIMVALANHVLSAVEAFISTKNKNGRVQKPGEFSNWKIKPTLKSYNSRRDTPYLKVTYKF